MIVGLRSECQADKTIVRQILCEQLGDKAICMTLDQTVRVIAGIIFKENSVDAVLINYDIERLRSVYMSDELESFRKTIFFFETFNSAFKQLDWKNLIENEHITFGRAVQLIKEIGQKYIDKNIWLNVLRHERLKLPQYTYSYVIVDDIQDEICEEVYYIDIKRDTGDREFDITSNNPTLYINDDIQDLKNQINEIMPFINAYMYTFLVYFLNRD